MCIVLGGVVGAWYRHTDSLCVDLFILSAMQNEPLFKRLSDFVLGPALDRRPPDRVARAIREQEDRSEVLVCYMQLAAVAFFSLFYALSPKGHAPGMHESYVPLTFGAYTVFTVYRLWAARRGPLTNGLLAASVIIDVGVLMATIWSFHLQYQQPAALYLKAPTLLYVFIIIALRALRFDPRWVILAGVTAAIGWAFLLLYAFKDAQMSMTITHSFIEYATSLKLLVGAEVDKIVSIAIVTIILAVAVERAHRLLVRSVADEVAAMELSRFFAPDIAQTIVQSDETIEIGNGVARRAAIMFIDLRGYTTLSSTLAPKDLVDLLNEYHGVVVPVVRRHDGSVITYLGDGIMISFGASKDHNGCAANALRAAEEIMADLDVWAERRRGDGLVAPGAGIGVAYGPITYGAIGTDGRLEYAVIGDPVSRSAKMQALTKQEKARAVIAADAWDHAVAHGYQPRRPALRRKIQIPGLAEPTDAVVIV
jgi:adenylate cyclase